MPFLRSFFIVPRKFYVDRAGFFLVNKYPCESISFFSVLIVIS